MKNKKIMEYFTDKSVSGFHTGNGRTDKLIDQTLAEKYTIIKEVGIKKVRNKDWFITNILVNPNADNDGYIIDKYSEFQKVIDSAFAALDINDFKWNRFDFCFSTTDEDYYEKYEKLNRLLIACFAISEKDHNSYDAKNFWTGRTKCLSTKNSRREVEFYDKKDESQGRSLYCARLELRSLRIAGDLKTEFTKIWFGRLDRALREFENVQKKFNMHLARLYLNDLKKPKDERDIMSRNSFILSKKHCIFTRQQMKDLLLLIGLDEKRAANAVYNFKKQHKIEYFEKDDLVAIVQDIKAKITEYFSK